MAEYSAKTINDFFDKAEKSVADRQTKIVKNTLDNLFDASPHVFTSHMSNSEYDANHKVKINNGPVSDHYGPTGNQIVSAEMIEAEKIKTETIDCGDRVEIFNTTPHAMSVEYGNLIDPNWKTTPGYMPYSKAATFLKLK